MKFILLITVRLRKKRQDTQEVIQEWEAIIYTAGEIRRHTIEGQAQTICLEISMVSTGYQRGIQVPET